MLIFYEPDANRPLGPWPIRQVIDEPVELVYVTREGSLRDHRQPGLKCCILDRGAALELLPFREWLHVRGTTLQIIAGRPVVQLAPGAEPARPALGPIPPGIRHRALELAQLRTPMADVSEPTKATGSILRRGES